METINKTSLNDFLFWAIMQRCKISGSKGFYLLCLLRELELDQNYEYCGYLVDAIKDYNEKNDEMLPINANIILNLTEHNSQFCYNSDNYIYGIKKLNDKFIELFGFSLIKRFHYLTQPPF